MNRLPGLPRPSRPSGAPGVAVGAASPLRGLSGARRIDGGGGVRAGILA